MIEVSILLLRQILTLLFPFVQDADIEMIEVNVAPDAQSESTEGSSAVEVVELVVTQTESIPQVESTDAQIEVVTLQTEETGKERETAPNKIDDTVTIVIDESEDEQPLTSPPRKSARLSAKRRDSTTESEISVTSKCDSPVPRRRSMRLGSTSSQDTPPPKVKSDSTIKKLPTIEENEKVGAPNPNNSSAENDSRKSENALVEELAAAFVEEFID